MKTVPIHVLKARLSSLVREAGTGEPILITLHGKPVALLSSPRLENVHVGRRAGKWNRQKPIFQRPATGGRYLEVLLEDRHGTDV